MFVQYKGHTLQGSYDGGFVYARKPYLPSSAMVKVAKVARVRFFVLCCFVLFLFVLRPGVLCLFCLYLCFVCLSCPSVLSAFLCFEILVLF